MSTPKPATERQMSWLLALLREALPPGQPLEPLLDRLQADRGLASDTIGVLKDAQMPEHSRHTEAVARVHQPARQPGLYAPGTGPDHGWLFKIVEGKRGPYAYRLLRVGPGETTWVYERGAIKGLDADDKVTEGVAGLKFVLPKEES